MSDDINGGYDIAEIEKWLIRYFMVGMAFPQPPWFDPPDRNHLFWSMVKHFGQPIRKVMMYHHVWTIH